MKDDEGKKRAEWSDPLKDRGCLLVFGIPLMLAVMLGFLGFFLIMLGKSHMDASMERGGLFLALANRVAMLERTGQIAMPQLHESSIEWPPYEPGARHA